MTRITSIFVAGVAGLVGVALAQQTTISEADVLSYASTSYDKAAYRERHSTLGTLSGTEVVVDYICSDVCPNYTVRIIHFAVEAGSACAAVGGVEKSVVVPIGIGATPRTFCFPKVITEHWDAYIR